MSRASVLSPDTPSHIRLPDGTTKPVPAEMTLDEFMAFPWPENEHWELIWGSPEMSPAPTPFHQKFSLALARWMADQIDNMPGHELLQDEDVLLPGRQNYLRPDIGVFPADGLDLNKVPISALPLLVVEILSPSTAARDWSEKKAAYSTAGVPEYWIVDPASGSLTIHVEPADGKYAQQFADADGYLASPFFKRRVRVRFDGQSYKVEDKLLP